MRNIFLTNLGNALVTGLAMRAQYGYNALVFRFVCNILQTIDVQCLSKTVPIQLKLAVFGLRILCRKACEFKSRPGQSIFSRNGRQRINQRNGSGPNLLLA